MYIHPNSFHVVGLVKANGSSNIKLPTVSADLSFFFISFFFSLLIFLFVCFSFDLVRAAQKRDDNATNTYYISMSIDSKHTKRVHTALIMDMVKKHTQPPVQLCG